MRFITSFLAVGLVALASSLAMAQDTDADLLNSAARRSVAVAAILDSPRDTPAAQLSAVLMLVDLGETDVASVIWKSLAEAEIEDAIAASLGEKFGTARLMKLARLEKQAVEDIPAEFAGAEAFAQRSIEAASKKARDPERLAKLIAEVNDPAEEVRKAARVELAATGTDGAQACLEALAQAEDETVRANLMRATIGLQPAAGPLLVAALVDSRGHFRRDVVELCGYLQIDRAVPFLGAFVAGAETDPDVIAAATAALSKFGHSVPNDAEARALLVREIKRIESGAFERAIDESEQTVWWFWHHETGPKTQRNGPGKFNSHDYDSATFQTLAAERLSRFLTACGEPSPRERELVLVYFFETPFIRGDVESTIEDSYSSNEISSTLAAALKRNRMLAATTCISILTKRNDPTVLISNTGRPSPLAAALSHGNRSIRFAALEAIMKLNPEHSFAGASRVPKVLWEFAAGAGSAQAVAASSVILRADTWAAQLREHGYAATPANSGRAALQVALNSPRIELLLIDSDISRPQLREIIYQLRSHERTARAPVAVLCSLPHLKYAQRIANADAKLFAIARPHTERAMQEIVDRLLQLGDEPATEQQLTEQAIKSLLWIGELLNQGHPYDELLRDVDVLSQTVHVPGLVEPSLQALAVAGTARSQLALVDFASQSVHPIDVRQLAAESFATSVDRFGKQLQLKEIQRQYERYNASESADTESQQVLSKILDVLEGKAVQASNANPELKP